MDVKARGRADEAGRNFGNFLAGEAGVHFEGGIVFAVVVGRPIVGQLAQVRNFCELGGFALLFFVFLFDGFGDGRGVDAGVLGVNLPELRVILDAFVEARLRDGGIVHFAVAVTTVADEVDDHVGTKLARYSAARRPTRTTASGSSALTWKMGTLWRRAMLEA